MVVHGRERKKAEASVAVNEIGEVKGIQERSIQVTVSGMVNGRAKVIEVLVLPDQLEAIKDRSPHIMLLMGLHCRRIAIFCQTSFSERVTLRCSAAPYTVWPRTHGLYLHHARGFFDGFLGQGRGRGRLQN